MRPGLFSNRHGFSLIEVLISIAILTTAIVVILSFLPFSLRQNERSADVSVAAYLAQQKAEEIRRDDSASRALLAQIRSLTTPTAPLVFPLDAKFSYQFSGVSILEPATDPGTARVIVSYTKPRQLNGNILFELRFGE